MRTLKWSALAIVTILATTDAASAPGPGMMRSANAMMQRIQTEMQRVGGVSGDEKGVACLPEGTVGTFFMCGRRFMVNKIVGNELWMVVWDAHMGMGDISGNVVTEDGVVFLHCVVTGATGPDPERDSLLMSCDAGDGASGTGWHHLDDVSLPGDFFLP